MIKNLSKHGNSLALVIDKPILELLHIEADTPLEIGTDGESLTITPIRDGARAERFSRSLERLNAKYDDVLTKLADS